MTDGGAERVAALWANGFLGRNHEVSVVVFDEHKPQTYSLNENIKLLTVVSHKKNRFLRVMQRVILLRQALKRIRPDVVIEVMPNWQRLIAMIGLRFIKISTEHNSFERPHNAEDKLEWFSKFWLNRLYDHVTVLTQADKDVIGNRLKHVTVLPNPLALEPVLAVPRKEKVVLAVGRKDDWHYKGFDNLISAWSQLSCKAVGWRLQIVGSSNRGGQEYLEHLCQKFGVTDSVEFQNYQRDIQPFYQQASIFVLSSRYEGFGLVLIEAMSQGCACIACDYKGRQSEILTAEVDGLTCEPDNVDALTKTLSKLMVNDNLREKLQTNAISRARAFTMDNIMNQWEKIINIHIR